MIFWLGEIIGRFWRSAETVSQCYWWPRCKSSLILKPRDDSLQSVQNYIRENILLRFLHLFSILNPYSWLHINSRPLILAPKSNQKIPPHARRIGSNCWNYTLDLWMMEGVASDQITSFSRLSTFCTLDHCTKGLEKLVNQPHQMYQI